MLVFYSTTTLDYIEFSNATGGIHSYFYYVNFAGNSINCQIKSLQEIIKFAIFISDFNKKWVITYCVIKMIRTKIFFFSFYYIHNKMYELFGALCPPMTRCK